MKEFDPSSISDSEVEQIMTSRRQEATHWYERGKANAESALLIGAGSILAMALSESYLPLVTPVIAVSGTVGFGRCAIRAGLGFYRSERLEPSSS